MCYIETIYKFNVTHVETCKCSYIVHVKEMYVDEHTMLWYLKYMHKKPPLSAYMLI